MGRFTRREFLGTLAASGTAVVGVVEAVICATGAQIYRSDVRLSQSWERQPVSSLPVLIGCDEFLVGYSLAGCPPAEPARWVFRYPTFLARTTPRLMRLPIQQFAEGRTHKLLTVARNRAL